MEELETNRDDINVLKYTQKKIKEKIEKFPINLLGIMISFIIGALSVLLILYHMPNSKEEWALVLLIGPSIVLLGYMFIMIYIRFLLKIKLSNIEYSILRSDADNIKEKIEEDFVNNLVKLNFKYLDQYYSQTREQANKSFVLSFVTSVIGYLIIIIGIILILFEKTTPAYITTITGIIGEFISTVFFYLYNKTIIKMSEYHKKLILTQNISLSLKITEDLPDDLKNQIKKELVLQLVKDINKHLNYSN